jgi:hypothetical protein
VTLLGTFLGSPGYSSFLVRLDASGNQVFENVFRGTHGGGFSPDGVLTVSQMTNVPYAVDDGNQMVIDANGNSIVGMNFDGTWEALEGGAFTTTGTPSGAGFEVFDATGTLRSLSTRGGPQSDFGALGLDPGGNVVLAGYTVEGSSSNATSLFLARMAE